MTFVGWTWSSKVYSVILNNILSRIKSVNLAPDDEYLVLHSNFKIHMFSIRKDPPRSKHISLFGDKVQVFCLIIHTGLDTVTHKPDLSCGSLLSETDESVTSFLNIEQPFFLDFTCQDRSYTLLLGLNC